MDARVRAMDRGLEMLEQRSPAMDMMVATCCFGRQSARSVLLDDVHEPG